MSIYRPNSQTQQALRRQKIALTARLRENLRLKFVSLATAVCLYVFVQADHNPTISRDINADVVYKNMPPDAEVDAPQRRVTFTISGPRSLVDSIKDNDVHAVASLTGRSLNTTKLQTIAQFTPIFSRLTPEQFNQISIDQTNAVLRFRLIGLATRSKPVRIQLKAAPSGYHYGKPVIQPAEVNISGREDRIETIETVGVDYKIGDDGKIKGAFPVVLRDHDQMVVENVTVAPAAVNVSVPLLPDAMIRVVTVSADIKETPSPPYTFYLPHRAGACKNFWQRRSGQPHLYSAD